MSPVVFLSGNVEIALSCSDNSVADRIQSQVGPWALQVAGSLQVTPLTGGICLTTDVMVPKEFAIFGFTWKNKDSNKLYKTFATHERNVLIF